MLLLQVLFFFVIFIIGIVKVKISLSTKKRISKVGVVFIVIPVLIVIYLWGYNFVSENYFIKPTKSELVGRYHCVDATISGFDESTYKKYSLTLNQNNTFTLSTTPYIELCNNGKYEFDYANYYNELYFRCSNNESSAHIDRHLNYYRIEFIIGDPDTGESIFFEKDK